MENRICTKCVMDTTDPLITFNEQGQCNHCVEALELMEKIKNQKTKLAPLVDKIKIDGSGKPYDCVIGISGGRDSTYVALLVKDLGLRPIAVHVDNGYNTEVAEANMKKLLDFVELPVERVGVNDTFYDLQLSFLKASVPDLEIPTDHALIAILYETAMKHGVKYILTGHNSTTESIGTSAWSKGHYDWRYVRKIQKKFGTKPLRDYPHMSPAFMLKVHSKGIKRVPILDYIDYDQTIVQKGLDKMGWQDYRLKHGESIYTDFVQSYVLPTKFGFDKRKAHMSNQILIGRITREQALEELAKPALPTDDVESVKRLVCEKLGITATKLTELLNLPNKRFEDYPSYESHPIYSKAKKVYKKLK